MHPSLTKDQLRFLSKVHIGDGCWLWTGRKMKSGYGVFLMSELHTTILAHRAAYTLFCGSIPQGLYVCHSCDITSCVNPKHLWVGTQKDNLQDMSRKGRSTTGDKSSWRLYPALVRRGSQLSNHKLTESIVVEARRRYTAGSATLTRLSKEYGVSLGTMCWALKGKTWSHV